MLVVLHCVPKSDAKIQITITTAYLIRIKCPLSGFNYHLSDVINVTNFNKIHRTAVTFVEHSVYSIYTTMYIFCVVTCRPLLVLITFKLSFFGANYVMRFRPFMAFSSFNNIFFIRAIVL